MKYDLNANNNNSLGFKLRHAYGSWQSERNTLTAGHTWSTLIDLKILPEGLTEPMVSRAIFMRQAQLRWTRNVAEDLDVNLSIEHPSGCIKAGTVGVRQKALSSDAARV